MVGPITSQSKLLVGDIVCQRNDETDEIIAVYMITDVNLSHVTYQIFYDQRAIGADRYGPFQIIMYEWFDDFDEMNMPFYLLVRDEVLPEEI